MGVSLNEQETVICIMRDEDVAHISTSDTMMMTKLNHRCEDYPESWKKVDENEYYNFYECPKDFISFRGKKRTGRTRTEEEIQQFKDRMAEYREQKRQEIEN